MDKYTDTVADPGGAPPVRAPYGSRFFRFDIQIFQNVATSGVGAPLRGQRPPTGKSWIRYWDTIVDADTKWLIHEVGLLILDFRWKY